jgi:hypothetical protein
MFYRTPSILTILLDKNKKQLTGVLLVKLISTGQIYLNPLLAMPQAQQKRFHLFKPETWGILSVPEEPAMADEMIKDHIDNMVRIAKDNSQPAVIASSVPIEVPGIAVRKFGDGWPADYMEQAGRILHDKKGQIDESSYERFRRFKPTEDLNKCLCGALWLAWRWNFFPVTAEQEARRLLYKGGAVDVSNARGAADLLRNAHWRIFRW